MNIFIWLSIILLLLLTEKLTKNLTAIWYAASATFSLILALIGKNIDNFIIEFTIFIILGTILIMFVKPKYVKEEQEKINEEEKEIEDKKEKQKSKTTKKKKKK